MLRTRTWKVAGLAGLILIATLPSGCEDTDLTAPAESTITIFSNAVIQINADAGETKGTTRIVAVLLDAGGNPVQDVPLAFTTTGGTLSANLCQDGGCTQGGGTCTTDAACPVTVADTITTDGDGIARTTLTLVIFEDPESVEVTVSSTVSSATVTVNMVVNTGPEDPVPSITASPTSGQRTGRSFIFNGTSTRDPGIPRIYCWDWSITSATVPTRIVRGADASTVNFTGIGSPDDETRGDHDLSVNLKVSDQVTISCPFYDSDLGGANNPPQESLFGPNVASLTYAIRCDLTAPASVNAGPNRFLSLAGASQPCQAPFDPSRQCVSVSLQGTGDDPDSPRLRYDWDCGNEREGCQDPVGDPSQWGGCQSITCQYDVSGTFTAQVTVTNECGLTTRDSTIITVTE